MVEMHAAERFYVQRTIGHVKVNGEFTTEIFSKAELEGVNSRTILGWIDKMHCKVPKGAKFPGQAHKVWIRTSLPNDTVCTNCPFDGACAIQNPNIDFVPGDEVIY